MYKKKFILLAIAAVALIMLAVTAFAGNYHGHRGRTGNGYAPCAFGTGDYGSHANITTQNREKFSKLTVEHREKMLMLNNRLMRKRAELDRIYTDPNATEQEKVNALNEFERIREHITKERTGFQNELADLTEGRVEAYNGYAERGRRGRYAGCW